MLLSMNSNVTDLSYYKVRGRRTMWFLRPWIASWVTHVRFFSLRIMAKCSHARLTQYL